jgi:hypothetical protein
MQIWAKKGTRPRQPADQRYQNAYIFGAICPMHGRGAALLLPVVNTEARQLHLDEISVHVVRGAMASCYRTAPDGIRPNNSTFRKTCPSYCYHPTSQNSLRSKTLGDICRRTCFQIESSKTMRPFWMPVVTRRTILSPTRKRSGLSDGGIGPIRAGNRCCWYHLAANENARDSRVNSLDLYRVKCESPWGAAVADYSKDFRWAMMRSISSGENSKVGMSGWPTKMPSANASASDSGG